MLAQPPRCSHLTVQQNARVAELERCLLSADDEMAVPVPPPPAWTGGSSHMQQPAMRRQELFSSQVSTIEQMMSSMQCPSAKLLPGFKRPESAEVNKSSAKQPVRSMRLESSGSSHRLYTGSNSASNLVPPTRSKRLFGQTPAKIVEARLQALREDPEARAKLEERVRLYSLEAMRKHSYRKNFVAVCFKAPGSTGWLRVDARRERITRIGHATGHGREGQAASIGPHRMLSPATIARCLSFARASPAFLCPTDSRSAIVSPPEARSLAHSQDNVRNVSRRPRSAPVLSSTTTRPSLVERRPAFRPGGAPFDRYKRPETAPAAKVAWRLPLNDPRTRSPPFWTVSIEDTQGARAAYDPTLPSALPLASSHLQARPTRASSAAAVGAQDHCRAPSTAPKLPVGRTSPNASPGHISEAGPACTQAEARAPTQPLLSPREIA